MEVEIYKIEKDIKVFCLKAPSFPEDIKSTHEKMHSIVPDMKGRRYFGISHSEEGGDNGEIVYMAGAEEMTLGEQEKYISDYGFEPFVIKAGNYISTVVEDFEKNSEKVPKIFDELLTRSDIDPQGYCLEWYYGDSKDLLCLVPIK